MLNFYRGNATGVIFALHADTGEVKWTFDTVESKDIWANAQVNSGGGAWYPPAIDAANGMSYWGIGNPAPFPGTRSFPNGSSRPGDNLYTCSIVALELETGKLVWYDQVRPHDLFDLDFQSSPILAKADMDGGARDIVIGSGKAGYVIAYHAKSGEKLWRKPVGIHQNDDLQAVPPEESIEVYPGFLGGVETPMAFAEGKVFVPVVNQATTYTATSWAPKAGGSGELVALDVKTGNVVWQRALPRTNFGGATVVNGIVFTSDYGGMIYAFDADDGTELWTYQAPAGINASPAVADDTIIFPAGVPLGPDSVPQLIAFRVGARGVPEVRTPEPTSEP